MILFYSEHCPHSKLLLDTIKTHDSGGAVKLISVETLRALRKPLPAGLHSVPGLLLLPERGFLFGKQLFDYLLLPGRGRLVARNPGTSGAPSSSPQPTGPGGGGDPEGFWFASGLSDNFSPVEDDSAAAAIDTEGTGLKDRAYGWSSISEVPDPIHTETIDPKETRTKKSLPSLDDLRKQREADNMLHAPPRPI